MAMSNAAATEMRRNGMAGAELRSQRPTMRPMICVPSVGMKLRVR